MTKQYQVNLVESTFPQTATPVSTPMSAEAARAEINRLKSDPHLSRHLDDSRWYEVRPAK
jgi:hypothetical protein